MNASLIFKESGFGPEVTEGAGATEWRREEAGDISVFPGMRIQGAKVGWGAVLQPQLCRTSGCRHYSADMALE